MEEQHGVLLIAKDGSIFGRANYDRFNNLPWYKRMFGRISKKYKAKYTDIKPIACDIENEPDDYKMFINLRDKLLNK